MGSIKLDVAPETHTAAEGGEKHPRPTRGGAEVPEPKPGETLPPSADPDFVEGEPPPRPSVTVALQQRHYDWLTDAAARAGRAPEFLLEQLVRQACAADPLRVRSTLPTGLGQPAGTARR